MIAAGTMHELSRACMLNELSSFCGCSQERRPNGLLYSHIWTGCGDNFEYGYKFSRMFLNAKEVLVEDSLSSISTVLMNLHNNEAGLLVSIPFLLLRTMR